MTVHRDFTMNKDGAFIQIDGERLADVLARVHRQYLVGNLSLPQELKFIRDEKIEIGITRYENETCEAPHWHPLQREYQYMLTGKTVYTDSITGKEYVYKAGDFYGILPEICYRQISEPGTTILFIKHPAVNDKIICRHCKHIDCTSRIEAYVEE